MRILTLLALPAGNDRMAAPHFDRVIKFPKGSKYAVILACYYGGKGYTTHRTMITAIAQAAKLDRVGHHYAIYGASGREYQPLFCQNRLALIG